MTLNGAAEAAKEALKGFQGAPALLLILLLNVGMLGAILYVGASQRDERQLLLKMLVENCQPK
jgi:hypothetical protein